MSNFKVLEVENLCKNYEKFKVENVSFSIDNGHIAGFIGRNGAGKTTTLKGILNLIHLDGGEVKFFGETLKDRESQIKKRIGYASGGVDYYKRKSLKEIASVTKLFYDNWDDNAYYGYLKKFNLDDGKRLFELSEGMKVKFNLTLALSHKAELLILDEPTSGLDPVSRDELLTIFKDLAKGGVAILFSTHITSDLEKCADDITYIKNGKIICSSSKAEFVSSNGGGSLEDIMIKIERA